MSRTGISGFARAYSTSCQAAAALTAVLNSTATRASAPANLRTAVDSFITGDRFHGYVESRNLAQDAERLSFEAVASFHCLFLFHHSGEYRGFSETCLPWQPARGALVGSRAPAHIGEIESS